MSKIGSGKNLNKGEGTFYMVREYSFDGKKASDRTVAIYTSEESAQHALSMIRSRLKNNSHYKIEVMDYIIHKRSLVAK